MRAAVGCVTLGLVCLLGAGAGLAHEAEPEPRPAPRFVPPPAGSYELPPIRRVKPHELLDEEGRSGPLLALPKGQAGLVAFVYLDCADACPRTHAVFQELDRLAAEDPELDGRLVLTTVSFDPVRDTPERLASLRRALAPRGAWGFRTAPDLERMAPVLADYGQDVLPLVTAEGRETGWIRHLLKVFLVDHERRIRNVYSTEFLRSDVILNDVRTVLRAGG